MAKVLFIKGTPQDENKSRSMKVARVFLDEYKKANPTDEVVELDIYKMDIPFIDAEVLDGWGKLRTGADLPVIVLQKIGAINELTTQFMNADKYIIQSSMWNLGIPPMLKAYIDTVAVPGVTFKYTEDGHLGLLEGKKAIHIHGSGGVYSNTTGIEHTDSYIKGILNLMGVECAPTVFVEGVDHFPMKKEEIIEAAIENAKEAARAF